MAVMLDTNERLAYSVDEFARLTGKTAPAIRADIDRGVLKARRWGRRIVVLRDDALAFLHSLPTRPTDGGGAS